MCDESGFECQGLIGVFSFVTRIIYENDGKDVKFEHDLELGGVRYTTKRTGNTVAKLDKSWAVQVKKNEAYKSICQLSKTVHISNCTSFGDTSILLHSTIKIEPQIYAKAKRSRSTNKLPFVGNATIFLRLCEIIQYFCIFFENFYFCCAPNLIRSVHMKFQAMWSDHRKERLVKAVDSKATNYNSKTCQVPWSVLKNLIVLKIVFLKMLEELIWQCQNQFTSVKVFHFNKCSLYGQNQVAWTFRCW